MIGVGKGDERTDRGVGQADGLEGWKRGSRGDMGGVRDGGGRDTRYTAADWLKGQRRGSASKQNHNWHDFGWRAHRPSAYARNACVGGGRHMFLDRC